MAVSANDDVARFTLRDEPVPSAELESIPIDRGDAAVVIPLSWSPDGRNVSGIGIGDNGQVLGGIVVHDLPAGKTRFLPVEFPVHPAGHVYPTLAWLPDSRRGVIRWGDRILLFDTATGTITTLLDGFNRDGGIVRTSGDGRWLYMLDSRDEGDLWMASRDRPPSAAAKPTKGVSR
jgi:hypothetical protein